ncbi:uncharacterized protein LOC109801376 [Cajanus cajan]|uniref:uncharacterized protein LOC109801368 n=1 Tax=Cajanus cajan TaxID=3821 RepID=UPI00098D9AD8|nr:uncharacterized protein LOC109801368 [Cajanus cajan]XP_020218024.2 uncharacterized protein LOC109801376 [Cajanus cajan]
MAAGTQVNWENFKRLFLEKYFPRDVRRRKQVEFLELKQREDSVAEYVTKFKDLVRFYPMYDGVGNEEDKCVKFDNRARVTHYKSGGPMKNHNKFGSSSKGKPYTKSVGDSSSKVDNQGSVQQRSQAPMASQTSRGGSMGSVPRNNCFNCGKPGHRAIECRTSRVITCFNYQEKGHKANECPMNRKGRVFALSGAEATQSEDLIHGMCFINGTPLIVLYDSGATHSFELIVETPTSG